MLELIDICKNYCSKDFEVKALQNINLSFKENEFVSILGPSGCGKTTLLNILGGLDKYDSGDLMIDGKSTKEFKDKDWDAYRNNYIGFVFQSYNLIQHLTILENVELCLTIGGKKPKERKLMAFNALKQVGLEKMINKKPNQLSGGQMQRVAIARAIVNNPEIILADEPTGALDTEISKQIMEILNEIAKTKLVIMVTHNQELAQEYSTRIINFLDGKMVKDKSIKRKTKEDEKAIILEKNQKNRKKKTKKVEKNEKSNKKVKTSMSFFTAFKLSFKNLFSKKAKTLLVSFAGSIGIIGVALVLAVSNGFTNYVNNIQSGALSGYPISVPTVALNLDQVKKGVMEGGFKVEESEDQDKLNVYDMLALISKAAHLNYLSEEFVNYTKEYYENNKQNFSALRVDYANNFHILTNQNDEIKWLDTTSTTSTFKGTTSSSFYQGFEDRDFVLNSYDLIRGSFPTNIKQVALVIDEGNAMSLQFVNKLGLSYETLEGKVQPIDIDNLIGKTFKVVLNNAYYLPVYESGNLTKFDDNTDINSLYAGVEDEQVITLQISCVLKAKKDATSKVLDEGIMLLPSFMDFYWQNCRDSLIVQKTIENRQLYRNFVMDVSELNSVLGGESIINFDNLNAMQQFIKLNYNRDLPIDAMIEYGLQSLGASELPTGIYVYPKSFDAKQKYIEYVNAWNDGIDGVKDDILITDVTQVLTNSLGQLIDTISYVLIAFASISLVVSSIMIGIITYTSVIERTKEIGVLRSIGARKKDISRLFNTESASIGIFAGFLGILITYLLCPVINAIVLSVSNSSVNNIAMLNPLHALILVGISLVLTSVAGLIPSSIASKKDPVICLRTE